MNRTLKTFAKNIISSIVQVAAKTSIGRYFLEQVLNTAMNKKRSINHHGVNLSFVVPNGLNHFRVDSFSTKEPETLEWIDLIPAGSVVWDIGANVGLYTCYAAKARSCRVYAFEPSVFNLELLARNIFINDLVKFVTILPLPLSEAIAASSLNMSSTEWGGALSTFGQSYTEDGNALQKVFEFPTLGISMVDAIELLKIPQPDFIKMDVDGIEHLILKGGGKVLSNVKGVLIEINESFEKQFSDSSKYLLEAGLTLKEKRHSELYEGSKCFNQIWQRV